MAVYIKYYHWSRYLSYIYLLSLNNKSPYIHWPEYIIKYHTKALRFKVNWHSLCPPVRNRTDNNLLRYYLCVGRILHWTGALPIVGLMLVQGLRRWPSITYWFLFWAQATASLLSARLNDNTVRRNIPSNTKHPHKARLLHRSVHFYDYCRHHRLRHWPNIDLTLYQHRVYWRDTICAHGCTADSSHWPLLFAAMGVAPLNFWWVLHRYHTHISAIL